MLQGIQSKDNIIQQLARFSWGLLPEIATDSSTITRDTLPPNYAQFYSDDNGSRVYFNINNQIKSMPVSDPSTPTDTDEKAKVSSNDTTAGYLNGKLTAGTGITLTEGSDGGNETLGISLTGTTYSNRQLFTANGTFTAPAGVTTVYVTLCAGGGGGGSNAAVSGGGGGGGGALVKVKYPVTPAVGYAVVVGAGGAAEVAGSNSTFDTVLIATGGSAAVNDTPGAGGICSGVGGASADGGTGGSPPGITGGTGGATTGSSGGGGGGSLGGLGGAGSLTGVNGVAALANSGGGGGGAGVNATGGAGGSGFCLVEW